MNDNLDQHPGLAAVAFVDAVQRDCLIDAWPLFTPDFRRARLQSWMMTHGMPELDTVVEHLALSPPDVLVRELTWRSFSAWTTARWQTMFVGPHGLLSQVRPVSPSICLAALTNSDIRSVVGGPTAAGEQLLVQWFVMEHDEHQGWRIAGIGRAIARPGWPPSEELLP